MGRILAHRRLESWRLAYQAGFPRKTYSPYSIVFPVGSSDRVARPLRQLVDWAAPWKQSLERLVTGVWMLPWDVQSDVSERSWF